MILNSRGAAVFAYAIVFILVALIALVLRFWSRALSPPKERGPRYWWDDWVALLTLPFIIISHVLVIYMTSRGLGHHIYDLEPQNAVDQLKALYACYIIYDISITLPKISALLFYARVFGTQNKLFNYACWVTHGLAVAWLLAISMIGVFLCDPIKKQWEPTTPGHCHPNTLLWITSAVPSVVIDLILLLLPLPMLWKLQMRTSRKTMIMTVFACGYCVIVISLGRMITVLTTADSLNKDITYASVPTFYWLCAEAPISVLSICLPTFLYLFKRLVAKGPRSLVTKESTMNTEKFNIINRRNNGTNNSNAFRGTPSPNHSFDMELGKKTSFDSTDRIYAGALPAYSVAAAETASRNSSRTGASAQTPIPEAAIRVKNEVDVQRGG
ncbi:hypothetical protein ACLMJK_005505 [Lecanora helva]